MKLFRSKSDFIYGITVLAIVFIFELTAIIRYHVLASLWPALFCFVLPSIIGLIYFIIGMQMIVIDEEKIRITVFGLCIREIKWENVKEAGCGKTPVNKKKYQKQLFVSEHSLTEKDINNLDRLKFDLSVIRLDYSQTVYDFLVEKYKTEIEAED